MWRLGALTPRGSSPLISMVISHCPSMKNCCCVKLVNRDVDGLHGLEGNQMLAQMVHLLLQGFVPWGPTLRPCGTLTCTITCCVAMTPRMPGAMLQV